MKESPSYPSYKKVMPNLNFIKKHGIEEFVKQQRGRLLLLETMIENYDDGRSRSFFCKAATLLEITALTRSLDKATQEIKTAKIKRNDVKNKAKVLRAIIDDLAFKKGLEFTKKK